jgi:hypothetical protein
MQPGKIWQAGARRLQFAHRNTDGFPVGTADPDTPPANTALNSYVIEGLREFIPHKREVAVATNRGDDVIKGQMYMGVKSYGDGSFELGIEDETFEALLNRSSLDTSLATGMVIRAGNDAQAEPRPAFLMATTRVQNIEDGGFYYKTWIYQNAQTVQDTPAPFNLKDGENPSPLKYKFVPSLSKRMITGHLFADTDLEVLEANDTYIVIRSSHPLAVTTWIADGVTGHKSFTLPYLPLYSDATGAANNIITLNGDTTAAVSVSTTTGLVTLSDEGDEGDIVVVLYQTDFTPSA